MSNQNEASGVLVIYTGGTIGSIPKNTKEPNSPLIPLSKEDVSNKKENRLFDLIQSYEKGNIVLGGQSIRLELISLEKPIDSSNVSPTVWLEITKIIEDNYLDYEGFVILNGTDTMTYTASVLSFMIENLNKPIIITGSQKPIGETRSDAVQNLVSAIEIAAAKSLNKPIVREVSLFFRNKLLRGSRTIKYSASNYEAFQSPNLQELGTADEYVVINENIIRAGSSQSLRILKGYSPKSHVF
ncbi:MAG: asparaginase [Bacteroidetes bacterium]|nr:asparaginase [Bacteroidota bacterium]